MIAYVTSIGEPTTDLCVWSLERQGFTVELVQDDTRLSDKLKYIYSKADENFLRVDADVTVTNGIQNLPKLGLVWWWSLQTFGMYSQQLISGGVQYIHKNTLPILRANIDTFLDAERPESQMYRLDEFNEPRRCYSHPTMVGIHGFGIKNIDSVIQTKTRRKQLDNYDFELAKRMVEFYK